MEFITFCCNVLLEPPMWRGSLATYVIGMLAGHKLTNSLGETFLEEGMSAMDVLDYIYQNLDSTLAYYDHAGCALGICARCTGRINGKAGLFRQVPVAGDVTLEPFSAARVLKDLVCEKKQKAP